MNCIRCQQPITPGQFYLHADYIPTDVQDLIAQPQADSGLLAKSPYRMHVTCPRTYTNADVGRVQALLRKHIPVEQDPTNFSNVIQCVCGQWMGMWGSFDGHRAEEIIRALQEEA